MNESACQRQAEGVSCGACCGIFNLDFRGTETDLSTSAADTVTNNAHQKRSRLLAERAREFAQVQFDQPSTFVHYRQTREAAEQSIPRYNPEIYVCPFYGTIDETIGRTGCLAHPARTGLAHTQNFSFYGASICQAYDCRNKDQDPEQTYSSLLLQWFARDRTQSSGASESYARLMADVPLYAFLERFNGLIEILGQSTDPAGSPLRDFLRLAEIRLTTPQSAHITSFEVGMECHADPVAALRALFAGSAGSWDADEPEQIVKNLLAVNPWRTSEN